MRLRKPRPYGEEADRFTIDSAQMPGLTIQKKLLSPPITDPAFENKYLIANQLMNNKL